MWLHYNKTLFTKSSSSCTRSVGHLVLAPGLADRSHFIKERLPPSLVIHVSLSVWFSNWALLPNSPRRLLIKYRCLGPTPDFQISISKDGPWRSVFLTRALGESDR